jgi:IS30 family transposase
LKKYKQLTGEQRYQIYALKKESLSQGSIARNLEIDKSTISTEIKRNTGLKGYRAKQATRKSFAASRSKAKSPPSYPSGKNVYYRSTKAIR